MLAANNKFYERRQIPTVIDFNDAGNSYTMNQ
jgi:hypothetical protein